jgi:hypothetical protein
MSDRLCQFFTPLWVAEALVERHFPDLDCADSVVEPTCGRGGFLKAIPAGIPAVGVEIDPAVAAVARHETGREIVVGDFRTVDLAIAPTTVIGNPPFDAQVFDGILERCHRLLPTGGRAGFILPAYFFQTANRVTRYGERWSLSYELLPRNAFHARMRTPLLFALFSKDARRLLIGFSLYREAADIQAMPRQYREALEATTGSAWKTVCRIALERLGGEAGLQEIYHEVEGNRPTRTQFWREQIRRALRSYADTFSVVRTGRYALKGAAA